MREIVLAIGSNEAGPWGSPLETLRHAADALADRGMPISAASPLFETAPVGPSRRPYLNAVVCVRTDNGPAHVMRQLKSIERLAGRRTRSRWSARALDLDIIADGGRVMGWAKRANGTASGRSRVTPPAAPSGLVLPHPRAHQRAFVLAPLLHIRPHWHHPVLDRAVRTLLLRVPTKPGDVRVLCDDWLGVSSTGSR